MNTLTRREWLTWMAVAGALPAVLVDTVHAAKRRDRYGGRVVVLVRMRGGNDGLNTVVPVRDDRYYAARPTIAIPRSATIPLADGDLGLHPALAEFHDLMEQGIAGVVQSVGYPESSRSHARATEIFETGSTAASAPAAGWLGRYLDDASCACAAAPVAAVQFGDELGLALASMSQRTRLVGEPSALAALDAERLRSSRREGPANAQFAALAQRQTELADAAELVRRADRGSGARYAYPDSSFGRALRYTANMIETECAPRAYQVTIGSFAEGAASFDTHVDELPQHELLYRELGRGLHAFAAHLQAARAFDRVVVLTFSDFGRLLPENRTRGTEHGDASVMFYAGGSIRAGLHGPPADLSAVTNGGIPYSIDFRSIYADVMRNWLDWPGAVGDAQGLEPWPIVVRG